MGYRREPLPVGTMVQLLPGNLYRITGEPMGLGGSSILYPAERMVWKDGVLQSFGLDYALKECYPVSDSCDFFRDPNGQIRPADDRDETRKWLRRIQDLLIQEGETALKIFKSADHVLPVQDYAREVILTLPQKQPTTVTNTVIVTDSLSTKGRALRELLRSYRHLTALESFRILQQLLFALRDIHEAGYLHLDIQDGNLFIQGSLNDGSDLVNLIDFGSARAMTEGKTAPIADRMIFSSEGYTAPEIVLHNDGTLQLGPEADLFSACCLLLHLLTGRKPDLRSLITRRSGIYLTPGQVFQMKCPIHLVNRVQRFLARGLAADPDDRYHSAEEMLSEVGDILLELQPREPKRKSVQYNAFICYQHNDVDSEAARALQESLERFRTPPGYPQLSRRPFRRVFVDEGELASCADLGQKIDDALVNSEWLVVVCSPQTPRSPWVEREIRTFLKSHQGREDHVLALMTSGTPESSFPTLLRGDGFGGNQVFAPSVGGSTPQEVAKNIRKDGFLKIAAPMLGRDYDDLKQRHLTWLLKQAAAVTAAIVLTLSGFTAYAVNRANVIAWQAERIQEEYENALRNESLFLAEQAQTRLDDNDPAAAMEILLQALPSQSQDRPVLPQAEYLLGEALGIYRSPSTVEGTVFPERMIPAKNSRFFLDDTGSYLFAWDRFGAVFQIWDARNLTLLQELPVTVDPVLQMYTDYLKELEQILTPDKYLIDTAEDLLLPEDRSLLMRSGTRILSLNYESGRENWSVELEDGIAMALSEDKACLAVLRGAQNEFLTQVSENLPTAMTLELRSAKTGEELRRVSFELAPGLIADEGLCLSPDLKWAAIPVVHRETVAIGEIPRNEIWLLDLQTGDFRQLWAEGCQLAALEFVGDCLALMGFSDSTFTYKEGNSVESQAPRICVGLETYDPVSGQRLTSLERDMYVWQDGSCGIFFVPYENGETAGEGILFHWNDCCLLMDRTSGDVLREYGLPSAIAALRCTENGFEAVSRDGAVTTGTYDTERLNSMPWFPAPVSGACRSGDVFYVQNSPDFAPDWDIRTYRVALWDEQYVQQFDLGEPGWQVYDSYGTETGNRILLTKENQVCLLDTGSGEQRIHTVPAEFAFGHSLIQGLSRDGTRLYWCFMPDETADAAETVGWIGGFYYELDLLTGRITRLDPPPVPEKDVLFFQDPVYGEGGYYIITMQIPDSGENQLTLWFWNLEENTMEVLYRKILPDVLDVCHMESLHVSQDGQTIWFAAAPVADTRPNRLFCLNRETETCTEIPVEFLPETGRDDILSWLTGSTAWMNGCYHWNSSGTLAVLGYGDTVYVLGKEGEPLCRISVESAIAGSFFSPDEESLILISETSEISRFRISDGQCLGTVSLMQYDSLESAIHSWEQNKWAYLDEETLMVFTDTNGFLLDLSREGLVMERKISHCFGYNPAEDRYLVAEPHASGRNVTVGSFPRYSVEDLIAMAEQRLGR